MADSNHGVEREVQKKYWMEHTKDLTVEAMMLDSKAIDLDKEERPEVLSLLPPYEGKSVLELGAGIGRFTGELVKKAGQVLAVDFIDTAIQKNEITNGHHKNVKFMCADVTSSSLEIADGSVDLIFSNWLLMYLSDEEVEGLAKKMVKWLKVGGYIFFRESCFHQSGDSKRTVNPTHYREPRFYTKLDLKPGQKVLDVGCGIGGGDFYMAEKYDVDVVGIDLSINMISFALERAIGLKCSVEFEVADCTTKEYPEGSFDVIYSRDTILHIQDKPSLFRTFYKWLKPGGKVLITDYCRSAGTPSSEFAEYIKQRGYDLHDVETYGQMLRDAGFDEVTAEDRTDQFLRVLQRELTAIEKEKDEFIQDFSEDDYNDIIGGWKAKLVRSSSGEQCWGLFIANKK
ncbi:hypothetical protein ACFE04_006665 [Oxalis oulophora]